ncbi:MAG: hypothetical protein V2A56_02370 [bacterium]
MDILNLEVGREGAGRPVVLRDVRIREVENRLGGKSRIVDLICNTQDGFEYTINSVFKRNEEGEIERRAMFLDLDVEGKIRADSTFAGFLHFHGVTAPRELIGKELELRPNENGHLTALAYAMENVAA